MRLENNTLFRQTQEKENKVAFIMDAVDKELFIQRVFAGCNNAMSFIMKRVSLSVKHTQSYSYRQSDRQIEPEITGLSIETHTSKYFYICFYQLTSKRFISFVFMKLVFDIK